MTCFEPEMEETLVTNPLVEAALEDLAARCGDARAGLTAPHRELACHVFRALATAGESFDPYEIRLWARRRGGFEQREADSLADLAAAVLAGRVLRFRHFPDSPLEDDVVDRWRAEARYT